MSRQDLGEHHTAHVCRATGKGRGWRLEASKEVVWWRDLTRKNALLGGDIGGRSQADSQASHLGDWQASGDSFKVQGDGR